MIPIFELVKRFYVPTRILRHKSLWLVTLSEFSSQKKVIHNTKAVDISDFSTTAKLLKG